MLEAHTTYSFIHIIKIHDFDSSMFELWGPIMNQSYELMVIWHEQMFIMNIGLMKMIRKEKRSRNENENSKIEIEYFKLNFRWKGIEEY